MSETLHDPRAYLQTRVSLFAGVTSALFSILLAADFAAPAENEPILSSTRLASLVVVVVNGLVWALSRRGRQPAGLSRTMELASVGATMAVLATLPVRPPIEGAGGVMALFAPTLMAVVLFLRAAVIPSRAWLSAAVTLLWGTIMSISATRGWEGVTVELPGQPSYDAWKLPLTIGVVTTIMFAAVAAIISHIVYGLQTRVRDAIELGQYTLERKIGEGGMGAVYRARHRMLRRPTAVKLLPPEKAGAETIARFEREVQNTSRLNHPNTVAIFDFGRTRDGVFYYAMEYLNGLSLQDLVRRFGPLPSARAIYILAQAADSLSEAHGLGLVHRDIKPANIVLCEHGGRADVVKVVDFGLVKDIDAPAEAELSSTDAIRGTPTYLAPETLRAPYEIDGKTDLYALGGVGYYLLTGQPPFTGGVVEVLSHHLHTVPEPLGEFRDDVGADLEAIIMRCLAKDPTERFDNAEELGAALRGCRAEAEWDRERAKAWWREHGPGIAREHERAAQAVEGLVAPV